MKKILLLFLALLLLAGLAACGEYIEPETMQPTTTETATTTDTTTTATTTEATTTTTTRSTTTATTTASTSTTITTTTTTKPAASKTNNQGSAYAYDYPGIAPAVAKVPADPYLILVSRDFALPANYTPSLKVAVEAYPESIKMETTAATQYKKMYDAALAAGAELIPYSGYRSIQRQKEIFDRKIASYISPDCSRAEAVNKAAESILPPGCSEHSAGLAMDITRRGYWGTYEDFNTTKEFAWLQAHGHEYGFILRYPKDKFAITQIKYEPWHWRYVGVGPATAMKQSGQCLEEYLGLA